VPSDLATVDMKDFAGDEGGLFKIKDPVRDVADLVHPGQGVWHGHASEDVGLSVGGRRLAI
jgi:hypothetical protein